MEDLTPNYLFSNQYNDRMDDIQKIQETQDLTHLKILKMDKEYFYNSIIKQANKYMTTSNFECVENEFNKFNIFEDKQDQDIELIDKLYDDKFYIEYVNKLINKNEEPTQQIQEIQEIQEDETPQEIQQIQEDTTTQEYFYKNYIENTTSKKILCKCGVEFEKSKWTQHIKQKKHILNWK